MNSARSGGEVLPVQCHLEPGVPMVFTMVFTKVVTEVVTEVVIIIKIRETATTNREVLGRLHHHTQCQC